MDISASQVKELREKTGCGIMDCKSALAEAKGDMTKAVDILKIKGLSKADKKMSRAAKQGKIGSYIHSNGKIGVLLELNCETDFVSNTEEYQALIKEICMQVAAASPKFVKTEDIPQEFIEKEREIYKQQVIEQGKPANVADKIVEGKLAGMYKEICLLNQVYIRDTKMTVNDLIKSYISKFGENIVVTRFARFALGE